MRNRDGLAAARLRQQVAEFVGSAGWRSEETIVRCLQRVPRGEYRPTKRAIRAALFELIMQGELDYFGYRRRDRPPRYRRVFRIPPHANAAAHEQVMAYFRSASDDEIRDQLVDAGVLTKRGRFTAPYRRLAGSK